MTNTDGWIKHDGGPCPIPDAKAGEWGYKLRNGFELIHTDEGALGYTWPHSAVFPEFDITHYRLIKTTPSDVDLLRQAAEALRDIAVYGCGMLNQPAEDNGPEIEWLKKRIAEYERRAHSALFLLDARVK